MQQQQPQHRDPMDVVPNAVARSLFRILPSFLHKIKSQREQKSNVPTFKTTEIPPPLLPPPPPTSNVINNLVPTQPMQPMQPTSSILEEVSLEEITHIRTTRGKKRKPLSNDDIPKGQQESGAQADKQDIKLAENVALKPKKQKKQISEATKEESNNSSICNICAEPYNRSTMKKVSCFRCQYSACRVCCERYFLGIVSEPHCPNCRCLWPYTFLYQAFTKVFVNSRWLPHRSRVLLNHQKSHLSQTMPYVQAQSEYERSRTNMQRVIEQAHLAELKMAEEYNQENRQAYERLNTALRDIKSNHAVLENDAPLIACMRNLRWVNRDEHDPIAAVIGQGRNKQKKAKKQFTWPCSMNECKGFLDDNHECGLCRSKFCKECHLLLADPNNQTTSSFLSQQEHKCKEADVETVKELKKSTRQCPNCPTLIYKISGCDQMYCTHCFTAFNYSTGEIVTGRIHNPHYYEHMRKQGMLRREPGDEPQDPCGLPPVDNLQHTMELHRLTLPLYEFHRQVAHIEDVEMPRLRRIRDQLEWSVCAVVMRIKFMMNRISEDAWVRELMNQDKSRVWAHEALEIYFTWCQSVKERLRTISVNRYTWSREQMIAACKELIEFTKLSNQSLHRISLSYETHLHYMTLDSTQNRLRRGIVFKTDMTPYVRQLNHYIYPVKVKALRNDPIPTIDQVAI